MRCQRCGNQTNSYKVSMFNTDECCMACIEKERMHPMYAHAREVERQHVLAGDYNFAGIGTPADL